MKFALRSLLKSPGYTLVALLTLALGIGVNTSMFSVVYDQLFRAAPFPDSENLVIISSNTRAGERRFFSEPEVREMRPGTTSFESLTLLFFSAYTMAEPGRLAERINALTLSEDMMRTLRIPPMYGRAFTPEEFVQGKNQVVLLNERFWRTRFGGDPGVIGRTLRLDGEVVTIVGVMPARFDYTQFWGNVALIRPLNFSKDQMQYRAYYAFMLLGRLKPGTNEATVTAQLAPIAAQQEKAFPQTYPGMRYRVVPLHKTTADDVSRAIVYTLLGLSGFVLLIACANLANLQLARATAAAREFAIRAALGASRRRLIMQQLNECLLLSVVGGLLGLVVTLWVNTLLERGINEEGAELFKVHMDVTVFLVALGTAVLSGALIGLAPALFASRSDVNATLKSQSRGSSSGRGHHAMRQALIIGEVALALTLLGGAAVMNRGFTRLLHRELGWDTAHVLTGTILLSETRFENGTTRVPFYRKVEARLAQLPGVESVALSNSIPLFGYPSVTPVFTTAPSAGTDLTATHTLVTPGFFRTLGIPLREGRLFAEDIKEDGPQQIVVNEALARRFWPNESAVGKRLGVTAENNIVWREIIGVVGNVEMAASIVDPDTALQVYRPLVQEPWSYIAVTLRSSQPALLAESARRAVAEIDADLSLDEASTISQFVRRSQHNLTVVGNLLSGFAALGVILAVIGLYGVISHLVAQRTNEFGIRLALGATPRDVMANVLGRGIRLALFGIVLGLGGAFILARTLASFMPRLASVDLVGITAVAALLFGVTLVSCWLPARRATKVDPLEALRAE